jgi:hypothetical protein
MYFVRGFRGTWPIVCCTGVVRLVFSLLQLVSFSLSPSIIIVVVP